MPPLRLGPVLILLLLDIPFWVLSVLFDKGFVWVLILLLLDIPFWGGHRSGYQMESNNRLNPSSAGYSFLRLTYLSLKAHREPGLNPSSAGYSFLSFTVFKSQLRLGHRLNPSSAGYSFLSPTRHHLWCESAHVLILLLLDIPFWA